MKPALSLRRHRELALRERELRAGLERLVARRDRADDLDELHDLRRVEVVQAEELRRARRRRGLVDDGQRATCWSRRSPRA